MNRKIIAAGVVLLVWGLVGCTPTSSTSSPSVEWSQAVRERPSPLSLPSPTLDATETAIMATLTGYYKGRDYLMHNRGVMEMYHVTQWATGEEYLSSVDVVLTTRERTRKVEGDTVIRDVRVGVVKKIDGVDTSVTAYCIGSTKRTFTMKSGERKPAAIPTLPATATIVLVDGKWKISTIRTKDTSC